jgi:CpeS-like protein
MIDGQFNRSLKSLRSTEGSTLFGAIGNILYRDRGFATPKPVTAIYHFPNPETMCLKTEYQNSVFEEEIKFSRSQSFNDRAKTILMNY